MKSPERVRLATKGRSFWQRCLEVLIIIFLAIIIYMVWTLAGDTGGKSFALVLVSLILVSIILVFIRVMGWRVPSCLAPIRATIAWFMVVVIGGGAVGIILNPAGSPESVRSRAGWLFLSAAVVAAAGYVMDYLDKVDEVKIREGELDKVRQDLADAQEANHAKLGKLRQELADAQEANHAKLGKLRQELADVQEAR